MVKVDAGVDGLKRCVDGVSFLIATNDVVAHVKRNFLFEMKNILYDYDAATLGIEIGELGIGKFVFLLLCVSQL